ncbi:MAG: anthranilate phosphoribosyltransferase, partial [Glaciecola sp.]
LGRSTHDGETDPQKARQIIAMNAGATIYVAGIASSLADGVALAEDLLSTGQAGEKLKAFVDMTQLMREEKGA